MDRIALNDSLALVCSLVALCAAARMACVGWRGEIGSSTRWWCWGIALAAVGMAVRPLYWGIAGMLARTGYHTAGAYDLRWVIWPSVIVAIIGYTLHLREPLARVLGPRWPIPWGAWLLAVTAGLYALGAR